MGSECIRHHHTNGGCLFLVLRSVEFGFGLTSVIGLCHHDNDVFWVGSCAGCALLVEWPTNGSLESSFQGLSNGAIGAGFVDA
eukprot:scaffold7706_cov138-Isochrysis_galbana.AAC.3